MISDNVIHDGAHITHSGRTASQVLMSEHVCKYLVALDKSLPPCCNFITMFSLIETLQGLEPAVIDMQSIHSTTVSTKCFFLYNNSSQYRNAMPSTLCHYIELYVYNELFKLNYFVTES